MAKDHLKPVDGPTSDQTTPTVSKNTAKLSPKKMILAGVAVAALGFIGFEGLNYWTVGRFMETTDDAYVKADVTLISSRAQGYVAEVMVRSNDHVNAGDLLARLDDGDARNGLALAQSRFETAGEALTRIDAQITAAQAIVAQTKADRDTAQAQLNSAQTNGTRAAQLASDRVVSQSQLDTANEAFDVARGGFAGAQARIASAEAQVPVLNAQHVEAEGQQQELKIAVDQARGDLARTVLTAPSDGIIVNLTIEIGDFVSPGARLAALIPDGSLYVEANLKETQMTNIAAGAIVEMTFDALPNQIFEGRVASISPATGAIFSLLPADNATGNFTKIVQRVPVRIALPQEALETGKLRAGLSTEVSIDICTPTPTDVVETE